MCRIAKVVVAILSIIIFSYCFAHGYAWTSKWEWEVQSYNMLYIDTGGISNE